MFPQTVLSAHNYYKQPGGEDEVFNAEGELLRRFGHTVVRYEERNARIATDLAAGLTTVWNQRSYRNLRKLLIRHKPDVAHFHNTFPLISPAGYYALHAHAIPVVQKLSNFRLLCPGATLLRDGNPCELCIERRSLLPALTHRCYRNSLPATAAVAAMLSAHRAAGTWRRMVDVYVAPTEFVRKKFVDGGLPPDRVVVKSQMIASDSGKGEGRGNYALFVGRLSEEKGIRTLVDAWQTLPDIPLLVAGDGPLAEVAWPQAVTRLGRQPRERISALMKDARVLIVPSICHEIGPLTVVEAFAAGLPVIASDLGSMAERVVDRRTGLLFRAGDAADLARRVRWAFSHSEELLAMRFAARREFEEKHTEGHNYKMLMDIYEIALENSRRRMRGAA